MFLLAWTLVGVSPSNERMLQMLTCAQLAQFDSLSREAILRGAAIVILKGSDVPDVARLKALGTKGTVDPDTEELVRDTVFEHCLGAEARDVDVVEVVRLAITERQEPRSAAQSATFKDG